MLKFPYALSDFNALISEDYFYVDRTSHIPLIENAGLQLLFLRPRRFGKTLLLSMLGNYYDVAKADQFERLFGHLAIGQNPTPKHNQCFVMTWDFSNVNPEGDGEAREIWQALYRYVNERIQAFALYYQAWLPFEVEIYPNNAVASFQSLMTAVEFSPHRLYLLVDEYDHFANKLMMGSRENSSNQHDSLLYYGDALRGLFKAVKSVTCAPALERVFITGVSPLVFSDMRSGYDVAEDIFDRGEFNDLCGFRESELAQALSQIAKDSELPPDKAQQALATMQNFYKGYCFSSEVTELVYHPTLAIDFLSYFQTNCQAPPQMLDEQLATEREIIRYISELPHGEALIVEALNEAPPLSLIKFANNRGVQELLQASFDTMKSLLYYFGALTLAGETDIGKLVLKIPNLAVRQHYVSLIRELKTSS
jgi:hypothetical protein